jgi:tripartite-type tricarboxylate transporter receptor subunit TctC
VKKIIVVFLLCVSSVVSFANSNYPSKTIKIYTNVSAGGSIDLTARMLAEKLQQTVNVPVVVINMPGGNGSIASNFIKNADPDGYTLYLMSPAHVTAPYTMSTSYHPYNDFTFIGPIIRSPMVLLTTSNSVKTFKDIANVSEDEKLTYIASNAGSGPHLSMLALEMKLKKKFLFVPHKGAGPSLTDFLGNHVDFAMYVLPTALTILNSNSSIVSAIAVSSEARISSIPNTPTLKELGVNDLSIDTYYGLIAPKGTPSSIVNFLNLTINNFFKDPTFVNKLNAAGLSPHKSTPAEFKNFIVEQSTLTEKLSDYYKERMK